MFYLYPLLITFATEIEWRKRRRINNKKTKAATIINIIKSLKLLLLPSIICVVKSVPQQMLRCESRIFFESKNKL